MDTHTERPSSVICQWVKWYFNLQYCRRRSKEVRRIQAECKVDRLLIATVCSCRRGQSTFMTVSRRRRRRSWQNRRNQVPRATNCDKVANCPAAISICISIQCILQSKWTSKWQSPLGKFCRYKDTNYSLPVWAVCSNSLLVSPGDHQQSPPGHGCLSSNAW